MAGANASGAQRSGRMAELARQRSLATLVAAYREGLALAAILAVGDFARYPNHDMRLGRRSLIASR